MGENTGFRDINNRNVEAFVKENGKQEVDANLQDQTTPTIILPFNQVHDSTTLTEEVAINTRIINVADATGIVVGTFIILFSMETHRFYFGKATAINTLEIKLDTPLDSTFPAGTFVDAAITNMNVDGSTVPQTFGLRGLGAPPGVDIKVDITRILFTCVCTSAVNLSLFANLTALLNGIVLRRRNITTHNIFNIKSNRELAGLTFDFNVSASTNPQQGEDGFVSRLTFGGQNKIGVVQRLAVGEDLELIIQDNLASGTPDITILECIAEGHIVED